MSHDSCVSPHLTVIPPPQQLSGFCAWPGVVWSLESCRKLEVPEVVSSYVPGCFLVHFYAEHSTAWIPADDLRLAASMGSKVQQVHRHGLLSWGKKTDRCAGMPGDACERGLSQL